MGALDHFLNGLDAILKANERSKMQAAAERAAKAKAKSATAVSHTTVRSFDAAPANPADPSCCLAKRRVK